MHVSRLYIVNYRSIRELDLRFEKGKNVIIGRNNCGKSNIIRALHIVLGETSPTYQKSENVALGDFHTWNEKQANVRNELLQSAIIPSFRDPQNQLRLSSWTWYGKLMQHLTAGHMKNADLRNALDSVRDVANQIF